MDNNELTQTNVSSFNIDTGETKPINAPTRRAPLALHAEYRDQITQCVENGIMKETVSPWSAPALMVRKPNNKWRLCVDYMKLNDNIKSDA